MQVPDCVAAAGIIVANSLCVIGKSLLMVVRIVPPQLANPNLSRAATFGLVIFQQSLDPQVERAGIEILAGTAPAK